LKFWDSSAVVPLLVAEPTTRHLLQLLKADKGLTVWWATPVECASAIARRERDEALATRDSNVALERLRALQSYWVEINPTAKVRDSAVRLLRTHPLRSSDSLQLAAAMVAAEDEPSTLGFVCLDERLKTAAQREGFTVAP
jgi:uncharacterized protein